MGAAGCENIKLRMFEIINNAFDECARVHEDLRQKVSSNILDLLMQRSLELSQAEFSTNKLSSAIPLPLPRIPQLSVHSSETVHSSHSWEPFDGSTDGFAESCEICSDAIGTAEGVHADALPLDESSLFSAKIRSKRQAVSSDGFGTTEAVNLDVLLPDESSLSSGKIRSSRRRSQRQECVTRCKTFDSDCSMSGSMHSSGPSDCIYLSLAGKLTRRNSFSRLPPWVRIVELLLTSDNVLISRLKPSWLSARNGTDVVHESSLVAASSKASFVLHVHKFSMNVLGSMQPRTQSALVLTAVEQRRRITQGLRHLRHLIPVLPLHPSSGHRLFWDFLCIAICLYDMIFLPMVAFDFGVSTQAVKDTLDLCIAMFWTLDICLSFCTAYSDGYTYHRGLRRIASSYIRSWFLVDLIIVINDWVAVCASRGSFGALRFAKLFKIKTLIRGVRLVRLYKMSGHYQMILQMMVSEYGLTVVKIGTQAFSVAMVCHYVACGWYALHEMNSTQKTWVTVYLTPTATTLYKYSTSLHWALTQLLPASINVQPVNLLERLYNVIVILVSMVVFSSFISSITVNMNHLRAFRIASIERESQLRKFFSQYDISPKVMHTIWSFIAKSTRAANSSIKPEEVFAFKHLPEHILEALYHDAFELHLRKHPLFDYLSSFEPGFMAKLCRTGLEQRFLYNSDVLWHDLMVDKMVFVRRGLLTYEDRQSGLRLFVKQGDWCCEEALWAVSPRISAPFSAGMAGCEMILVKPDVFQFHMLNTTQNPNTFSFCARYGEEFTRTFNEACYDFKGTKALFNGKKIVVDILKGVTRSFKLQYAANR